MAASIPCTAHPPFSAKCSSSSKSLSCSFGSHLLLPGIPRFNIRRVDVVGPCDGLRAKCCLKFGENGAEGRNLEAWDLSGIGGTGKFSSAILLGALLAAVELPAMAVTGVNDEEDLIWTLTQLAIVAFFYLLVAPPIIMNWLRIRWYRRNVFEMYVQFMFVFIFFPGILLWAPFLNFRKFPRDPSMKYPWSVPEDPSQIKNSYLKYPFAQPEDYD